MAETIRDVTIRVSLKQVQGGALKFPEIERLQQSIGPVQKSGNDAARTIHLQLAQSLKAASGDADLLPKRLSEAETVVDQAKSPAPQLPDAIKSAKPELNAASESTTHKLTAERIKATKDGELKTVEDQLKPQREALVDQQPGFEAQFGDLNPLEQRRVIELSRRRARGETSFRPDEEALLPRGGASAAAEQSRAARGRTFGATEQVARDLQIRTAENEIATLSKEQRRIETQISLASLLIDKFTSDAESTFNVISLELIPAVQAMQANMAFMRQQVENAQKKLDAQRARSQALSK